MSLGANCDCLHDTNRTIQPTISGFSGYKAASPVARVLSALQLLPVTCASTGSSTRPAKS